MKDDLISRDYLKSLAYTIEDKYCGEKQVVDLSDINNAPTVNTDEIYKKGYHAGFFATHGEPERPQGEWTIIDDTVCECPRCKHQQTFLLSPKESNVNFCEKCGADMRGAEE